MPRAALSVLERLGADDIDRFIDACARRERARRAQLQRKASAAAGGTLAAFLAVAGAEAREDNSFAEPERAVDDFRVASADDILSFAEICATEGEGSIFEHAAHAARSFAAASFEEGFASRLASRFGASHEDGDHAGAHAAANEGMQAGQPHRGMSAHEVMHSAHAGDVSASVKGHGGHHGEAGDAPIAHSQAHGEESFASEMNAAAHGAHGASPIRDNAGGVELHASDHAGEPLDDAADGDLTEALNAFLGAQDEAKTPVAAAAPEPVEVAGIDHGHATLAESAPAETLVAPLAEI